MKQKKSSWMSALFAYAKNAKGELGLSVVLSVVSILLGLVPFFCMYRVICLFAAGTAAKAAVISWCAWSLAAYAGKVLCFTLSTGISHHAAYNILEGLRLRLVERFLHAPLGEVQKHSIGEIKSILVDKIENIEPPLAHMIPEGAGHIVLAGILVYLAVVSAMEKKSVAIAAGTQKSQADLTEAVLENVQGMSVIKSFNLSGRGDKKLQGAVEESRRANLAVGNVLTPYTIAQEAVLQLAGVGMMLAAILLWQGGTMTLAKALMVLVMSFMVFNRIKAFGMGVSMLRMAAAASRPKAGSCNPAPRRKNAKNGRPFSLETVGRLLCAERLHCRADCGTVGEKHRKRSIFHENRSQLRERPDLPAFWPDEDLQGLYRGEQRRHRHRAGARRTGGPPRPGPPAGCHAGGRGHLRQPWHAHAGAAAGCGHQGLRQRHRQRRRSRAGLSGRHAGVQHQGSCLRLPPLSSAQKEAVPRK